MANKKYEELLNMAHRATNGAGAAFSRDEQGNTYVNEYTGNGQRQQVSFTPEQPVEERHSKYEELLNMAYHATGGAGAAFSTDEEGNVYVTPWEAQKKRQEATQAENNGGGVYKAEDMSTADSIVDRLLGVDRTQVTGEKTKWGKLLGGSFVKGLNQWNALNWKSMKFLFGDLAEDLHALGTETVNGVVDALNLIPGVNLNYIGQDNKNLIEWGYEDATKGLEQATEKYKANANSSRAAQIVDQFGTSTVAAIPMAIEAVLLAPAQASAAGGAATTAGLQYFSGLQSASGMEATAMMAKEGLTKLFQNPQFWTSYLQVAGDGYESAKEEGMSDEDAGLYGLVNGFFNAMVEIGGADEALGGIQNLPMRLQQQGGKHALVEWFKDAVLGEAKEEVIQGMMERGLLQGMQGDSVKDMFSLDPTDTRAAFNPWTAAQEAIGGGVVGAVLGGGQVGVQKAVQGGMSAAADAITTRQEQRQQAAEETGRQLIQQVVQNMDVSEAEQQILNDGYQTGNADPQTYAQGIQEAFRLGEMGLSYEQAVDNSQFSDSLNETQFRHAWEIGARKAGHSTEATEAISRRGVNVPEYESIEDFAKEFKQPEAVKSIFNGAADMDINEFAQGFQAAYNMGQSGVSANYLTGSSADGVPNVPTLSRAQAQAAYDMGRQDAAATAQQRVETTAAKQKTGGNQARVRGAVRGDGVSLADLRKTFNSSQNTAYRLLTRYADTTGVNIVLYNSQANPETGLYPEAQGRFQWKDDTIYVDINSGLFSSKDVNGLGNYTMMRTFAHEFTHFIEKWNAAQYNEFREFVFQTMEARGQNVHDMIEAKQALDESGNMTYEQASREVVADAMMDILPDSTLVQQLANEHPNVFRTLLRKLREFAARMKQYYKGLRGRITEAETLKENGAYLDDIVQMWDNIAKGAVRNYQGANGDILVDQPEKPANLPKRNARQQRENAQTREENAQNTEKVPAQPEKRRVGMEFFKPVESSEEAAPDLRQMAAQRNRPASMDFFREVEVNEEEAPDLKTMVPQRRTVGRDRFPANDFTSQAEEGPDLKGMVPRAQEAPSEAQETQAAEEEPETPAAAETPAREESARQDTPEGAKLREALSGDDRAETIINGIRYFISYDNTDEWRSDRWYGEIRRTEGESYTGVIIENARNQIYGMRYPTREAAVDDLVRVAENNNLLKEAAADESTETPVEQAGSNPERNGTGAVRVHAEREAGDVQPDAAGRQPSPVSSEDGGRAERHGDRTDAAGTGRSRSEGTGKSGVQPGHSGDRDTGRGTDAVTPQEQEAAAPMTEEEHERQAEELREDTEHDVEEKSTEAPGGNNYVIGDSLDLPSGSKARYKANVDAIRIVKQLEAEGRNATPEEQAALARYVGWGGIPEAFDEKKGEWSKEFAELKELLTDEEYKAARASTTNAHYTSIEVIKAMYEGLRKLGFKGGRMLEPSSGVGNFVGAMPADMTASVRSWTMVELDNITGLIAKHLYPQNDVRIEGFEKAIIPDNFMDVAIGNVPFGNYPIVDRAFPKKVTSAIHNYFFAKSLNKVRPGGLVMFITSSYTMNSNDQTVRKYIAKQADLLGAIRLPNTAFKGNAGTEVVTDILILKKRAPGTEYAGQPFIEASYDYQKNLGYRNEYFVAHPEMIMGEEATTGSMYRRNEYTVNPKTDAGTLGEQVTKAFENISGQMDYPAQPSLEKANLKAQRAEKGTKPGAFVQKEGKLFQNLNGELIEVKADEKTAKRINGMIGIRNISRQLMDAMQQGANADSIKALRSGLNKAYDSFVKEHGFLNSPANKSAFKSDPDCFSLFALENWDAEKKTATKADIFKVDTIKPNRTVTHADTVKDGLTVSRNTTGGVDVPLIARLTGKSETEVTRELIESELAFKNRNGGLEPAETYLSGNVRAKLRDAQGMVGIDKDYQHNVDALKMVIPEDIPHEQIFVQPGTPWIPESVYSDFAAYILGGNNHRSWGGPDIQIHRSNQTGNFTIDLLNKRLKANYRNTQEFGTPKRSFLNLLEAVMNSRSITVTYKDAEGHTIVDRVATDAANEKIEQITKKFQEWLWEDEERTKDLEYLYNETFNNLVTPKYDGSSLTVNGLRAQTDDGKPFGLRPHQADAVQRVISCGGNTLLAHRVGAGKTLEMAAAAMKLKELGIVQKPMFTVPKSLVAQWGKEFKSYFPAAKILVAEQSDFTPANRKTFANRIATGNYDAIIVSYEQFEKIPISDSFAVSLYQEQIDEIIQAINEAKEESGKNSMSVKDMEKKRKQLEAKVQKLTSKAKDTDSIEFEQLGIDSIFVDEAHNFKNLFYTTAMNNVSGLGNKDGSQRAFDLYTKVRYLQQLNGGRGIVFATATPVMNSMSEMYIMQKYLQSDLLKQLGLSTFDAWAKQFGEVVNGVEIKPSGQGYRIKQSFSRFKNMNELQLLFRNFSDVLTKVPGLKIPKMKGGAVKVIECEPGEFQKSYMEQLTARADNIKNVDPSEDNMLKITSDGRKISYTQRMIDPSLPYEEGCKIYMCADKVAEEYKASKDIKGTQIIFCDMATPKGKSNNAKAAAEEDTEMDASSAQLYDDLKKRLVKLGIPAKEIAFIHDADTDAKKTKLFADVNDGKVRVLIGSTGKMGVGMNAQKRIVAIHHLDAPWRPGDVEQRDGRAFRQKNINEEVSKYVYVTKGSFDARLWDIIDRKSSFIGQIMNGENVGRDVEDTGEVTLSAAEVKALASGSPLILEQVQLETDIKKLENLYMAHRAGQVEAKKKLQEAKQAKAEAEARAASARKDIKHRTEASTDDKFSITVRNKTFTDKKEAGKALMVEATAKATEETYTKIGSFAGFDISVIKTKEGILGLMKAEGAYKFNTYPDNTTLMITNMQKVLNGLDAYAKQHEALAKQKAQEIKAQETMAQAPFPKQADLDQKRQRYNEIMEILNPKDEQTVDAGEDIEEESTRQQAISDRDILAMAADEIDIDNLTPGEQDALRIFRDRLTKLEDAQEQRAELGRQYKEQQFTKGGSRSEADKIRAAMSVLDSKIKSLENGLLSLENKDVLKSVLQKARRVVETEERKRGDENLKRYRERRNESMATRKYRERVRREVETLREWLMRPSNKDQRAHVPAEIQKTVADFIESINFMSKTALRTSGLETTKADERYLKNLRKMRDAIKANVDTQGYSGYADLPEGFVDTFNALITKAEQHIGDSSGVYVVNQMSAAELQQLAQTIRTLRKYIVTMNSFHNNAMFQHAYEAGEDTIEHLKPFEKSKKSGKIYSFLRFGYMRPSYAFEHFGKGGQSIEHEFREGQATQAFLANRIIDFAKKTYTGKEVEKWSKETKTFTTTDGETVTMPITHLMSLYCLNKRPQALTHIYGDGIRVANYKNGKQVELDEGHIVTIEDVQQMIQELTPRQREVADALQKYMSTETATWGNYVSLARFDVEQFTEENYFPINSDGRYLSTTADESPDNAGLYALLNSSFTKELKENADNRIILYNIFDVFANHTASMTQYRSFALPVLDALKWFNYKNDTTSVRTKLSSAFGAPLDERAGSGAKGYAEQFVINLLKAYNGTSAQGDPYDTTHLKILHRYNGAAIAFNLRVVIQQPTAITRAAMILSPVKLTKGLGMSIAQMRKLADEMEAHSGIAAWKALGFYDTNISRGLTDLIKQNPGVLDRTMEIGTKGAELADRFTWAAMWYAAKDSVKRSDYRTEEEYFKAVTDLFEEVIYKTQVVDSLLTKAEYLRSKGFAARQAGSFMSEPSATMSMLTDAYFKYTDDLQQGMGRSEAWKRNGKNIAKTAAVYAIGQIVLSAMQAVIDAWRDQDDEDPENWLNNYIQKYLKAIKGNIVEEELIFGKIPWVSEAWEGIKGVLDYAKVFERLDIDMYGNDVSSGFAMYTKYLDKSLRIIIDKLGWSGNKTNYTNYGVVYNLLRGAANMTGIPIATALREVQDVWNNLVGYHAPSLMLKTYERAADRKKREGYTEFVQDTGLSQSEYNAIYTAADTDNDGIEQAEIGPILLEKLSSGELTQQQAEAIWNVQGWQTDFQKWAKKNGGGDIVKTEEPASVPAATKTAVPFTPMAAPAATAKPESTTAGVTDYNSFKKSVPIYNENMDTAYSLWESTVQPLGISLSRYADIIIAANADGAGTSTQDEMGMYLVSQMNSGELSYDQCSAIWHTIWNKARSKTFAKWLNG